MCVLNLLAYKPRLVFPAWLWRPGVKTRLVFGISVYKISTSTNNQEVLENDHTNLTGMDISAIPMVLKHRLTE